MTFMTGEKEDKRVVVTELGVSIVTKSDPHKQMKFTQNRWARFLAIVSEVDEEAKELNRKTREVHYAIVVTLAMPSSYQSMMALHVLE